MAFWSSISRYQVESQCLNSECACWTVRPGCPLVENLKATQGTEHWEFPLMTLSLLVWRHSLIYFLRQMGCLKTLCWLVKHTGVFESHDKKSLFGKIISICMLILYIGGQRSTSSVTLQELFAWFPETGSFTWTWPGWPVSLKGTSLSTCWVMNYKYTSVTTPSIAFDGC